MDFLMNAFRRVLESFPIKFQLRQLCPWRYELRIYDLPIELDSILVKANIRKQSGTKKIQGRDGYQTTVPTFEEVRIGEPCFVEIDGEKHSGIYFEMTIENYASKINLIERYLREFYC